MSRNLICPKGHRWQQPDEEGAANVSTRPACPICDAEAVSALYAPDADRIEGTTGTYAKGRTEIAAMYRKVFERLPAGASVRFEYAVRFIRPDVALIDGTYRLSTGLSGPFTLVITNEGGQWLLAAGRQGRGA